MNYVQQRNIIFKEVCCMKIGTEIVLQNATRTTVAKNIGDNGNVDIEGVVIFEPGSLVPVILSNEQTVGCYAKIISVTISELKTHVIFEFVKVSKDIADAAYKIYAMSNNISNLGSYQSRATGRSEYNLNSRDDDDDDDNFRVIGHNPLSRW